MRLSNDEHPPPYGSETTANRMEIPPLPQSVTLKTIYTDFMRYLLVQTRKFFEGSVPNGPIIWNRIQDQLVVVIGTPNGWDISQQSFLRTVAISSGWVDKRNAAARITFVTEGEASVHYSLAHRTGGWLEKGVQFMVVDAGGSTVDSTLYECKDVSPRLVLEEVCASECIQVF